MSSDNKSASVTVGVSLAVHATAILLLVLVFDAPTSGAVVPAPQTMELMLPPMMTEAQPVQAVESPPVEEVKPQDVVEPEPEPVTVPVMAEAVEVAEAEVVVVKEPEPEKPKPPKPKPRREAERPRPPKPVEEVAPAPPSPPAAVAAVVTPAPAIVSGGGDPGARADYGAKVAAWINRHKRYSERAERRQIEGMPWVRFVLDRQGNVVSCTLHKSSGRPELDEAALDTIARGNPFPVMPDEMPDETKAFIVPIDFSIKKRR
ncbi:energy transducer TonB [Oleomonas cavernae]|uniref:Energy transducer TonB n=1 Tax=Oleomonas cavernae TaxID=2320859 RepID=A0A418VU33_9PROT|nr:energy transducer TonB [Oleomonas cavernae]RJF80651.1 energy transducer TonB [Oleomonas cavernae]